MAFVDPSLRPALIKILPELDKERYTAATLKDMRELSNQWATAPDPTPAFAQQTIVGPPDNPELNVYIINRQAAASERQAGVRRPAILHIHGGGYILGRAVDGVKRLQQIALAHNCVIVSVDYRLAPEAKFPAALEDNYAALHWLHDNAAQLGVDERRIAVMGESAGGGHAAALAIAARDRGKLAPCFQLLIYPMLDDRTGSSRQPQPWIGRYMWRREDNVFGWSSLLGQPAGSAKVSDGAVPARVAHLAHLPPAFIGVGSVDLFVDEDMEYARRLIDAGVATELYVAPGAYHGFNELVPEAPVSVLFEKALNGAIARAFAQDQAAG